MERACKEMDFHECCFHHLYEEGVYEQRIPFVLRLIASTARKSAHLDRGIAELEAGRVWSEGCGGDSFSLWSLGGLFVVASSGLKDFSASTHYCVILPEWARCRIGKAGTAGRYSGWWSRRTRGEPSCCRVRDDRVEITCRTHHVGITGRMSGGRPGGLGERGWGSLSA